jgi:MIF4G like
MCVRACTLTRALQVAPAVSSAVGALFHELPRMDFHSRRQLAYWFANHLKDTGEA